MQYLVIYVVVFISLNHCNSFSRYRTSLKEEEGQKIDNSRILATYRSGTSFSDAFQ